VLHSDFTRDAIHSAISAGDLRALIAFARAFAALCLKHQCLAVHSCRALRSGKKSG